MLNLKTLCTYFMWGGEVCQKVKRLFMLMSVGPSCYNYRQNVYQILIYKKKKKMGTKYPSPECKAISNIFHIPSI